MERKRNDNINTRPMARYPCVVLDLITSFAVFGYIVAVFTGSIIDDGFFLEVEGAPALIAFVLIVAYFILVPRFFGGRVWHRILRAKPRRRSTRARC